MRSKFYAHYPRSLTNLSFNMHQNLTPKLIPLHVNQNNSFTHIINNNAFKKSLLLSNFEIQYTIILSNVQPSVSANTILFPLLLPPSISIILSTTAAFLSFISGFQHFQHQPFHPAVHPPTSTPISPLPSPLHLNPFLFH